MSSVEEFAGWAPWLVVFVLAAGYLYGEKLREHRARRKLPLCAHGHQWHRCPVCREG